MTVFICLERRHNPGFYDEVIPDEKTLFPVKGIGKKLEGLPVVSLKTIWTYIGSQRF